MTFITKESARSYEHISGLGKKLANLPQPKQTDSICCWSDLLGFGAPLAAANWKPDQGVWDTVTDRVVNAHLQCYNHLAPGTEFVLTLNDGVVRCCDRERFPHLDHLSMWLRACIWTHNAICESELSRGLPGARTVLAAGPTLKYSYANLYLDDFVYNYTKPEGQQLSNVAQQTGNPVVATNPGPLQMNLAFTRAYLLDRGGTRIGLAGPHFFIDYSVLELVRSLASELGVESSIVDEDRGKTKVFGVAKNSAHTHYYLGFELSLPQIDVADDNLKTTAWQVVNFYPCDESVEDCVLPIS